MSRVSRWNLASSFLPERRSMCSGRSSDFRLILLPRLPISRMETVAFLRDLSPGTAAGPFRHQTGFPFHPLIRTPEAMWALIYPSPPVKSSRFLKGEGGSPVRKIDESRAKLRGTQQPVVWVSWYPAPLCPDLGRQGGFLWWIFSTTSGTITFPPPKSTSIKKKKPGQW